MLYNTSLPSPHLFLQPIFLESESQNEDLLLRFFDFKCPYYDHCVTNNQASCPVIPLPVVHLTEFQLVFVLQSLSDMIDGFINTSVVRAVVHRVQTQVDPGMVLACASF